MKNVKDNAPPDVEVLRFSSLTLEVELENNTNSVLPFFTLNVGIMIAFCVLTCMMTDWVKSKPLLGFLGVVSSILGTIAALGLAVYIGIPFTGINLAAPFLMLGKFLSSTSWTYQSLTCIDRSLSSNYYLLSTIYQSMLDTGSINT